MRLVFALLALAAFPAAAQVLPGHRLPEGPEHPVRERAYHIEKYVADLRFDMAKEEIAGTATVTFTSLRAALSELSLDAALLDVKGVERDGRPLTFTLDPKAWKVNIALGAPVAAGQSATVKIAYACHPHVGMYFFPAAGGREAQAWNYGEGGLHNGWLPIYNDTNDRFAVEFVVTVPHGFTAVSNGVQDPPKENADGTRTFRWIQEKPIPNYLMTVDVGVFARVPLADAKVGAVSVPLAVWTPPGTEKAAEYTFGETPKMVEFFSQRMGFPYPWVKYDQVVLGNFAVGAMETTTMTGVGESHLHVAGDPPDSSSGGYDEAWTTFTAEDTIAHELAHHWFGDFVTCRSIGSIWLNESFATFWHTVWNGHAHGEDDLTYQRWWYLNKYVDYVRATGTVRPMEYLKYTEPTAMYQEQLTYVKGSLVLHMVRHFMGDPEFYAMIGAYLRRNQLSSVESADLAEAIELAAGRNFSWFVKDWVVGGGGHPRFAVSYRWAPERKQVDLTVRQIQSDLPFENDFQLPVDVEIADAAGAATHRVELSGWSTTVALPAASRPSRVTFDKGGWLVCEVKYERPIGEVLDELAHGDLAARLRAARQLADDFGRDPRAVAALARVLADPATHWGLKQEAALDLGKCGGADAVRSLEQALGAEPNPRVRRAVAIGLGTGGAASSAAALRRAVETDRAEDVIGAAEISLGRLGAAGTKDYLTKQLARESRYWDSVRVGALQGLGKLEDPSLSPLFASYTDLQYVQEVRAAAVAGWAAAAPDDPKLAEKLRRLTSDRNRTIRENAVQRLGALHHESDLALLRQLSGDPDPTIAQYAKEGVEGTEAFTKK
ncbi:MAG TPA: M1 family aminopeptidase [Thermoanaerobaculia bacterium]